MIYRRSCRVSLSREREISPAKFHGPWLTPRCVCRIQEDASGRSALSAPRENLSAPRTINLRGPRGAWRIVASGCLSLNVWRNLALAVVARESLPDPSRDLLAARLSLSLSVLYTSGPVHSDCGCGTVKFRVASSEDSDERVA